MSDSAQIILRFSSCTRLQEIQGGRKFTPVQEPNRTLKILMEHLVESNPKADEDEWARLFLKLLLEAPILYQLLLTINHELGVIFPCISCLQLANNFLFSYLQVVCWYAAKQVSNQLQKYDSPNLHYLPEECFLIGCELSLKPAKIIRSFNFNSPTSVQTYAQISLTRTIKNQIISDLKAKSTRFSDNGLLRNLSKRKLEKALLAYGYSATGIKNYCLVWQCFNELFAEFYPAIVGNTRTSKNLVAKSLTSQQLNLIAKRYNQRSQRLKFNNSIVNGQEIQKMLTVCVQAARTYQDQQIVSIEENSYLNNLASYSEELLEAREKETELKQLKDLVLQEFKKLDSLAQNTLLLWLGLQISQIDFCSCLQLKEQYQVARYFQKQLKTLLKAIVQIYWQQHLHQELTKSVVNQICQEQLNEIKNYLTHHSKDFWTQVLNLIISDNLTGKDKELLHQDLKVYLDLPKKDTINNLKSAEILEKITSKFQSTVESKLKISLEQFASAETQIGNFVFQSLIANQAILF